MSSWAIVALIAIVIWGIVKVYAYRHDRELGITRDEDGNPVFPPRDETRTAAELAAARAEMAELKERVKVLERIATDAYSGDAREQARIAAEIEALRALPGSAEARKEERSQ